MPSKSSKRPRKSPPKKRSSPRRGERKSPEEARVSIGEMTSGSERSTLDPKTTKLIRQDEKALQVPKGRLSGDVQGLSQEELADSEIESVQELVEEGQDFEGELVQGIENAPPADQGEVRTHAPAEPNEEAPDYKNRNRL
jgi:hypothetical protein